MVRWLNKYKFGLRLAKKDPSLLLRDLPPTVGTGVVASQPFGETRYVVRMLTGTTHHPNLG